MNLTMKFINSNLNLNLSKTEVTAGRDNYVLSIEGLNNVPVRIVYTVNDGPLQAFTALLDAGGKVTFDVSGSTSKGSYRFLAFSIAGRNEWIKTDEALTVH